MSPLTVSEQALINRATPDLCQWLDDDARESCARGTKNAEPGSSHEGSIAERLNRGAASTELAWAEHVRLAPEAWFRRFGAIGLVATAFDGRDRVRLQGALGPDALNTEDLQTAISCGSQAKAAIRDAAAVLNRVHRDISPFVTQLGMYLTAMAVGRRFAQQLELLASDPAVRGLESYVESALTTSRLGASRELRDLAEKMR